MSIVIWTLIAFVAGAIPFSVLLGRRLARADIRRFGDANPGAVNAWKAGGAKIGAPALLLDFLKGAIPVGLAHFAAGLRGWALAPIALAPILGHAFSPLLRFRGGKAVAVTVGVWSGVTFAEGSIVLGLFFTLFIAAQTANAWSVVLGMLGLGAHLALRGFEAPVLAIWIGNLAILLWKHRRELREPIRPRAWIVNILRKSR
jgi:glycerol-3-phosphate acyltransferase PlsY